MKLTNRKLGNYSLKFCAELYFYVFYFLKNIKSFISKTFIILRIKLLKRVVSMKIYIYS